MLRKQSTPSVGSPSWDRHSPGGFLKCAAMLATLLLAGSQAALAQDSGSLPTTPAPASDSVVSTRPAPPKEQPESELSFEGLDSYGNYHIFAGGSMCHLYTGGIEYDRHSWGSFLGARMDYAGEFLPLMLLTEPARTDFWGDSLSPGSQTKTIYGIGLYPIGLRMTWFSRHRISPYLVSKGGVIAFDQKIIASASTYEEFSLKDGFGLQVKTSSRFDLRLGLWGDLHFSNGFMTPSNPGLDVMNSTVALTYHLGKPRSE